MNEQKIQTIVDHMLLVNEELMFKGLKILSTEDQKIAEKILLGKIASLNLHRDVKQLHHPGTTFQSHCYTRQWEPDISDKIRKLRHLCARTTVIIYNDQQYTELKYLRKQKMFNMDPTEHIGIGQAYCSIEDQFNRRYGRLVATIRAIHYVKSKIPPQPLNCEECSKNDDCPVGHDFAGCTGDVE